MRKSHLLPEVISNLKMTKVKFKVQFQIISVVYCKSDPEKRHALKHVTQTKLMIGCHCLNFCENHRDFKLLSAAFPQSMTAPNSTNRTDRQSLNTSHNTTSAAAVVSVEEIKDVVISS